MSEPQEPGTPGAPSPGGPLPGEPVDDLAVAVVGAALRVPGSETTEGFWRNLTDGGDRITRGGASTGPHVVRAYGSVPHPAHFDPARYGISEAEAVVIDPQQRLLLDVADEALASANVDTGAGPAVAVYAGVGRNDYEHWLRSALTGRPGFDEMALEIGTGGDYAATRVAYRLGLRGAAVNVQSACSTGLLAVHLAAQDLLGFGCETAVAAVSAVRVPGPGGYTAPPGGIGSPDGVCRPFDLNAGGSVPGDGACAVVLKRLEDAVRDGDEVWAVLRGSAVNNDGAAKSGFAGVNPAAQRDVVRAALGAAGLVPGDIDYVEAHGSGTRLGDAAEWSALSEVFAGTRHPVRVGAVKSNLGHLREAAGLAGLLKTVLALRHELLPPTAHFERLPADLRGMSRELAPVGEVTPWPRREERVRRAGVSAFGLGGTNVHVVLEEASPPAAVPPAEGGREGSQLLLVSSHREETLAEDTAALREFASRHPERLGDIAWTTQTARTRHARRGYVVTGPDGAGGAAEDAGAGPAPAPARPEGRGRNEGPSRSRPQLSRKQPEFAFVLPGIGSHYPGMGSELARTDPVFAAHLRTVTEIADRLTDGSVGRGFAAEQPGRAERGRGGAKIDVRAMLRRDGGRPRDGERPPGAGSPRHDARPRDDARPREDGPPPEGAPSVPQTPDGSARPPLRHLHLSLFCLEHAMARTLMDLGLRPAALLGHSLGEWVSAVLAGIITLPDAMEAVARRADLVTLAGQGAMLAVLAPASDVAHFETDGAWLAADNSAQHCVLSGRPGPMRETETKLREHGFTVLPVGAHHPFHTPQLASAAEALGDDMGGVLLRPATIPIASSVLGTWLEGTVPGPGYWNAHMTSPVRFREAAGLVLDRHRLLIEIGPGTARPWLSHADPDAVCVRTVRQSYENAPDQEVFLEALGELWTHGVEPDWRGLHHRPRRRVTLPAGRQERRRQLPDTPPPEGPGAAVPRTGPGTEAADTAATDTKATDTRRDTGTANGTAPDAPAGEPRPLPAAEADGSLDSHLARQWRTLLGLCEVHRNDHFFHLGGDSLMGVHLIAGLSRLTGRNVPSSVVFAEATLGGMTEHVRTWLEEHDGDAEPGDGTAAAESPPPARNGQEGERTGQFGHAGEPGHDGEHNGEQDHVREEARPA
ncbi:type I polyketide synthase [Streptomyces winkii]|uniref:type I polyketide synthase n=1 Tax=Streptomyces winkii TaxID=3051178 RepID=UPI0028D25AEC|nr:beta-ketoacyl synthase N-terminal-like domain-containing protein [Streptomyces sp. DSM 40971]